MARKFTVDIQEGTYQTAEIVWSDDPNEERESILARAWAKYRKRVPAFLSMAYTRKRIVKEEESDE